MERRGSLQPLKESAPAMGRFSVQTLDKRLVSLVPYLHNRIRSGCDQDEYVAKRGLQRAGVGESRRQRSGRMDLGAADRRFSPGRTCRLRRMGHR